MADDMYDERGFLKTEYLWTESQKKAMLINNDIEKIVPRTDFGKDIVFKSIDGSEHASMEGVEKADKAYFDKMLIDKSHKNNVYYAELEKAYFDCITPNFNIKVKDEIPQLFASQQAKIVDFIKERYGSYLCEVLEQFEYDSQDNRGPKR